MALYNADGAIRITLEDTTKVGNGQMPDGSWRCTQLLGTFGARAPDGSLRVTIDDVGGYGAVAKDGSLRCSTTRVKDGSWYVEVVGFSEEAQALFSIFEDQPSLAHRQAYDRFYRTLKNGPVSGTNILAKFQAVANRWDIWAFWGETAQQSSIPLINPTRTPASLEGSPAATFTASNYFETDGTQSYVNLHYNPVAVGLSQNTHSMGVFMEDNAAANPAVMGWNDGTDGMQIIPRNANNQFHFRSSTSVLSQITGIVDRFGLSAYNRSGASATEAYKHGAEQTISTNDNPASAALNSHDLYLGHTTTTGFSAGKFGACFVGPSLTADEHRDLADALAVLRMELMFTIDADLNIFRAGVADPLALMITSVRNTYKMMMLVSEDGKAWQLFGKLIHYDPAPTELFAAPSLKRWNGRFLLAYANNPPIYSGGVPSGGTTWTFTLATLDLPLFEVNVIARPDCSAITGTGSGARTWGPELFIDADGSLHTLVTLGANGTDGTDFTGYEMHPLAAGNTTDLAGTWTDPVAITSDIVIPNIGTFIRRKADGVYRLWYKDETTKYNEYAESASPFSGYVVQVTGDWNLWGDHLEAYSEQVFPDELIGYNDNYQVANIIYYVTSADDGDTYSGLTATTVNGLGIHHPAILPPV